MCSEKLLVIASFERTNASYKLKILLIQQILCIHKYSASIET